MLLISGLAFVRVVAMFIATLFLFINAECQVTPAGLNAPNTSASSTFTGLNNGTISGTHNISKVDVHTLLYPGATTKILVHYLPWWNASRSGINVGYRSDDPVYINKLFNDLTSRGVDGLIIDWYGQADFTNRAWLASIPELQKFTKMTFSIMIDSGSFKFNRCAGCDVNATVLYNLDYIEEVYIPYQQYLRYNGHPVVFEFGLTSLPGIDWTKIQAAHPEIYWVHLDNATSTSGFDITNSNGSFLWVVPPPYPIVEKQASMAEPNYFYGNALTKSNQITVGATFKGFNSSLAAWDVGVPQYIPQTCGATWLETFATINKYYSAAKQLPFLQLVTWNDYEEGTELETGIENCATLSVSVDDINHALNVHLTHVNTIDHLELYKQSQDGTLVLTNTFPATMMNIPMTSSYGTFYLRAVGKPFMKNVLSQGIIVNQQSVGRRPNPTRYDAVNGARIAPQRK